MEMYMQDLFVRPIPPHRSHLLIMTKHYARRIPQIQYAFGLMQSGKLIGVCTFGQAPTSSLSNREFPIIELNRLVLINNEKKLC